MAYADKSCDMRRVCIAKGGHVQWEGVDVNGCEFVLLYRSGWGEFPCVSNLTKEQVMKKIDDYNLDKDDDEEPLMLLYQDGEDCDWNVKADYVKINDINQELNEKKKGK